jgi:hypothetical protein
MTVAVVVFVAVPGVTAFSGEPSEFVTTSGSGAVVVAVSAGADVLVLVLSPVVPVPAPVAVADVSAAAAAPWDGASKGSLPLRAGRRAAALATLLVSSSR